MILSGRLYATKLVGYYEFMTSNSHAVLRLFRTLHLYIGIFISPALLFFAFTGALQTFSLHETTQGSSYKPPAWIATLAQLHKKQTTTVPVRRPRPSSGDGPGAARGGDTPRHAERGPAADGGSSAGNGDESKSSVPPQPKLRSHLPMKCFFLLVSVGLFISTLTGLYMAYRYKRNKLAVTGVLVAGVLIPLLLLPF
jgi:hypothetical protein